MYHHTLVKYRKPHSAAMHMLIVLYHSEMIETETFSYFSNFLAGVTSGTRTTYHCAVPDLEITPQHFFVCPTPGPISLAAFVIVIQKFEV
jgi:hypothetical protein